MFNDIGRVHATSGQPKESLDYYYQELNIHRETDNPFMESVTLNNIVTLSMDLMNRNKPYNCLNKQSLFFALLARVQRRPPS